MPDEALQFQWRLWRRWRLLGHDGGDRLHRGFMRSVENAADGVHGAAIAGCAKTGGDHSRTPPIARRVQPVKPDAFLRGIVHEEAVRLFERSAVRNPDHADLQNVLGFSYRNLKRYDLAFKHYERAIALDPRHRGAHEYIGETYLLTGNLAGAQKHLAALREICLLPCDELKDLERAIARYQAR